MNSLFTVMFFVALPLTSSASQESDAYHAVMEASYKQSGLDKVVEDYTNRQIKKVPKELQTVMGNAYLIGKIVQERKVSITWSF